MGGLSPQMLQQAMGGRQDRAAQMGGMPQKGAPPMAGKPNSSGYRPPLPQMQPPMGNGVGSFQGGAMQNFNQQALNLAGPPMSGHEGMTTNPLSLGGGTSGFQPNIPGTTLPGYHNAMGQPLGMTGAEPRPAGPAPPPGNIPVPGQPYVPPGFRIPGTPGASTGGYFTDGARDMYGEGDPAAGQGGTRSHIFPEPAYSRPYGGIPRNLMRMG